MKVMFKEAVGEKESMLFIILADDEGMELKKYPVYINEEMTKKLPVLMETYSTLPDLIKMVYNSGKNGEKIEFIEETFELS